MRANGPLQRHAAAHPVRRPQTQNIENGSLPVSSSFSQSGSGMTPRGSHLSLSMALPRKLSDPREFHSKLQHAVTVL